jgi:hypothetical protein
MKHGDGDKPMMAIHHHHHHHHHHHAMDH